MPWTAQRIGISIALVSITAFFAALIVAFGVIIRSAPRPPVEVPAALWFSTLLLLISSAALELARYSIRRAHLHDYRMHLDWAAGAGIVFLLSQLFAWFDLWKQGLYLRANPQVSVFFAFTGFHALHVVGGLAGLIWLRRRARHLRQDQEQPLRHHRQNVGTVAIYWHFMGLLWLVLFLLLLIWS